jgi:RNA polymerase sigma-70 factor (ECF subfamily)
MPPYADWFAGREDFGRLIARVRAEQGTHWRLVRTAANGQPAVAAYVRRTDGSYHIHSLQVLTIQNGAITRTSAFQDARLYDLFDLTATLQ